MTLYAIPPLIGTVAFGSLALFVLLSHPRTKPKTIFGILCVQSLIWQFVWLLSFFPFADSDRVLTTLAKLAYLGITFLPFTFYHFIVSYLKREGDGKYLRLFYASACALVALLPFTDLFVKGNRVHWWGHFTRPGILYPLFVILGVGSLVRGLYLLYTAVKSQTESLENQRIKYLLLGFGFYSLCALDFFQVYGFRWYPTGSFFFIISAAIIAYAITRHQLLDIRIIIKKTFIYSIAASIVSLIYFMIVFSLSRLPDIVGDYQGVSLKPLSDNSFLLFHHSVSYVVVCITTLGLAGFVYLAGKRKETNIVYALYTLAMSWWSGFGAFALTASNEARAVVWWRVSYVGVTLIAVLFVHFIISLYGQETRRKKQTALYVVYAIGGLFIAINAAGYLVPKVEPIFYLHYYAGNQPMQLIFLLFWMTTVGYGLYELILLRRSVGLETRNRLNYFCVATLFGYVGGWANFLPTFGVYVPFLIPFGNYLIPVYVLISVYGIVAQQLIDIQIVIRKTFFYFLFAVAISLLYVLVIFGVYRIFAANTEGTRILANLFSVLVIAILFKPLEMLFLRILDKRFFKGSISEISEQKDRLQLELERRERLKAVGILASGMAHEIKNPLTAINTFVEYLPQKYDDPAFRESFERIMKSEVSRIKSIVQELMDFSKPRPLNREPADLKKLIGDTVDLLSKDMMANKVVASLNFPTEPCVVTADRDRIKQALLNIILNAIEAMKERGGELSIEILKEGRSFRISVADTGCGIPHEKISKIFDPFYTQKDEGTGLGLAITHSIIEQHKGRIEVLSEVGKGTCFSVYLPAE